MGQHEIHEHTEKYIIITICDECYKEKVKGAGGVVDGRSCSFWSSELVRKASLRDI